MKVDSSFCSLATVNGSLSPATNLELVSLARTIVNDASARGAVVRLFGGVAVLAHCESIETHPNIKREHGDLDFIAPRQAWPLLGPVFEANSFTPSESSPDLLRFSREGLRAEVRDPFFREKHSFDISHRLTLDPLTAPLADLLIFKLQRSPFQRADFQDTIALLLDHRVAAGQEDETINLDRVAEVACRSFPLWDTIYTNTVELEKSLKQFIDPEEAQLVWRRIELVQGELDRRGKPLAWWSRALFSRRLPWYH